MTLRICDILGRIYSGPHEVTIEISLNATVCLQIVQSSEAEKGIVKTQDRGKVGTKRSSSYKHKFKVEIPANQLTGKIAAALLLAGSFLFAGGLVNSASATGTGEIWLSSTNSLNYLGLQTNFGSGTLQDPYYGDFDYIFGYLVTSNTVVHLGNGNFWTKSFSPSGGYSVIAIPSGVTIQGEGQAFTTIKRSQIYTNVDLAVLYSTNSGISVRDLTVDCNGSDYALNSWSNAVMGILLRGSYETVEHVTIINGLGFQFAPEGFQMIIGSLGEGGNKVIGCTTSNFLGTYGDGVQTEGDCVVEGNSFYFPVEPAGIPYRPMFGINVAASGNGTTVVGNYVYGGGDGVHNDTGGDNNVVIANNVFENVCTGVYLTGDKGPYESIIISHNLMTQVTNYPSYQDQRFMVCIGTKYAGETNRNIIVDGNIIRYYQNVPVASDGVQGAIYIYGGANQLNENVSIINNQIDARMPIGFTGNFSNFYASGNIPLNGTNFASNGNPSLTNFVPDP